MSDLSNMLILVAAIVLLATRALELILQAKKNASEITKPTERKTHSTPIQKPTWRRWLVGFVKVGSVLSLIVIWAVNPAWDARMAVGVMFFGANAFLPID